MIGRVFSHYRIIEQLGAGGMGVLYKAEDTHLGRQVALKFLNEEFSKNPQAIERFQREARAASALNHPNICTVYDFGIEEGMAFLVMEILEGQTLKQRLSTGAIEAAKLIDLAIQIAGGFEAAHDRGIVHRDIKPANIFLTTRGQAKVLDFGLARLDESAVDAPTTDPDRTELTSTSTVMGTVPYMSPEQAKGERVDARSDIFSFGSVLYEMATGRQAFPGLVAAVSFDAILNEHPSPMTDSPQRLEEIVFHALEKAPRERYQSMAVLRADLEHFKTDFESGRSSGKSITDKKRQSIAVLSFADMSSEQDQEYFCDGMAEELINALANTEGLQVTPRITAFQFKGKSLDIRTIGRRLRVDTLLEGSVRKAGNKLRITAQLIDVASGKHVWSERYDRDAADVFAIQDEIARSIVDKLKIQLQTDENVPLVKRYTEDVEAYHLYLKGRFYWNKRYEVGVQKGISSFQAAIEKDPNYALAYTGLADSLSVLATYNFLSPTEGYGKAKILAERALALDDTLAEAHTSLGYVRMFHDWNWAAAEKALKRAIELNPSYAVAHYWYGVLLAVLRRFDAAKREAQRARDLDPMNALASCFFGWVLLLAEDYDRSIAELKAALEIDSNSYVALSFIGMSYSLKGIHLDGTAAMTRAVDLTGRSKLMLQGLAICYGLAGDEHKAHSLAEEPLHRDDGRYLSPFYHASIHAAIGENEKALDWLERGYAERDGGIIYMQSWPLFKPLHSDPRFRDLLRKMAYPASSAL